MNIVQFGGDKMNKVVTSKEAILDVSRNIAATQGLKAINMRNVAKIGRASCRERVYVQV